MRIWIVNPYGTLPDEGWRAYRSTLVAQALAAAGHDVVWWISNFDHRSKRVRAAGWERRTLAPGFAVQIVPAPPYRAHISLARVRYEQTFARHVAERAAMEAEPDVLVLVEPALFTAGPLRRYLRGRAVTLIIDILDLWPELFRIALPRPLRWLDTPIFWPLRRRRARLLREAHGVVAITRDYLDIVPRDAAARREVVYAGVDVTAVIGDPGAAARSSEPDRMRAVYAGTLGDNYDIVTILDAAVLLRDRGVPVDIVIAGEGPGEAMIRARIARDELRNVEFVGRLGTEALATLYSRCAIALSSYVRGSTVSMPIKAFDYLAAGLALVNSLGRDLERFVTERGVGLQYEAEDAPSLAAAIERLAADRALRESCRRNARALAGEFDVAVQYPRFVAFVEDVHSGRRRPAAAG